MRYAQELRSEELRDVQSHPNREENSTPFRVQIGFPDRDRGDNGGSTEYQKPRQEHDETGTAPNDSGQVKQRSILLVMAITLVTW